MDLKPYIDDVRRELIVAAEAGGDDARELAERLVAPLESAMRLALLNALSAAADEITGELAPGSVDVRLRGVDPSFVVSSPTQDWYEDPNDATVAPVAPPAPAEGAEGGAARINFRPSESLKARIEEAANKEGLSINAWLIRAITAVLSSSGLRPESRTATVGDSFKGWVR